MEKFQGGVWENSNLSQNGMRGQRFASTIFLSNVCRVNSISLISGTSSSHCFGKVTSTRLQKVLRIVLHQDMITGNFVLTLICCGLSKSLFLITGNFKFHTKSFVSLIIFVRNIMSNVFTFSRKYFSSLKKLFLWWFSSGANNFVRNLLCFDDFETRTSQNVDLIILRVEFDGHVMDF